MTATAVDRQVSRSPMERGQLVLLVMLTLLTVGTWAVTIHQARTMDMSMGVVLRAAADPTDQSAPAESSTQLASDDPMAGMEMDDSMGGMDMSGMNMPATQAASDEPSAVASTSSTGMAGMDMGPWNWAEFGTFLLAWAVMMAAMMFPAAAPMLLLFHATTSRQASSRRAQVPTWIFAAGYLLLWTVAGVATWLLVQLISELGSQLGSAGRETWTPLALGATLVIAGIYQFTPLKGMCLRQCQSPVGFLMTRWRGGFLGALRMGLDHGIFCLGCCWALFAVLVAAGVMSLAWMLLLTLVVFAEKVLPLGRRAPQAVGMAFLLLGILVGAGAAGMPWMA